MKVTVHCEGTPAEISEQLTEAAKVYDGKVAKTAPKLKQGEPLVDESEDDEETSAISMADIKAKRAKKGKKAKAEEPEDEELSDDDAPEDDEEVDADDESEETEEDFDEEETEEDEGISESDLSKLKGALKAFSAKKDRKQAVAILNKFAERSDLVKPADLPKLLKALKV